MPPPIQIMLVDDEPLVIFALQEIIEHDPQLTVIATASDAHDALSQLRHIRPDIVILDLQMPHMHGIECLKYIRMHYPDIIVMLLSTFDDDQYIVEGFLHGARSYLLKKHSIDHLTAYIHDAMNNTFVMPATLAHKLAGICNTRPSVQSKPLTRRFANLMVYHASSNKSYNCSFSGFRTKKSPINCMSTLVPSKIISS